VAPPHPLSATIAKVGIVAANIHLVRRLVSSIIDLPFDIFVVANYHQLRHHMAFS